MANIVPVLMYHHVTPSGGAINVSPEHFEDQLKWLKGHGYQAITCDDLAKHLNGTSLPAKSVLITFDDGYLDNYVYAWPLLKKYGFKATIFIVTSWVGDGAARKFMQQGDDLSELPTTPNHEECKQYMQDQDYDRFALRWSEIDIMRASGVCEFHSHTHTHTRWDKLDVDKNQHMQNELSQSRLVLERQFGSASEHLCWPQGYFDDDYIEIAHQQGFRYLYTTRAFGRNLPGSNPDSIFRFAVRNTTGASVGRRIRVAENPFIAPIFNSWKKFKKKHHYAG